KTTAGVVGNAYALVADGIESLSDVFSSFVVYVGLRVAMRPPDESHPYGHGKAEPIAAIVVGAALLAASVLIAWEGIHNIRTPHETPEAWTLAVLAVVMAVKETLYRYVSRVGRRMESTAVSTDAWHHRSDAITSAFAFVGISIAVLRGPGWEAADDWAALGAAAIIAINALRLMAPAVAEITDMAPRAEINNEVREVARGIGGVLEIEKCLVRKMGFDYYVDMHVIVDPEMTVRESHEIAHRVKDAVREANPRVSDVLVHIEPQGWH
ncbi:MAG TPA: cation diffusion facilitator family transporter, partial [Bryobacteraceae bacterium]|nr:cation diffusion facilitator family transporter [Bryobacteraceae bacterium]